MALVQANLTILQEVEFRDGIPMLTKPNVKGHAP